MVLLLVYSISASICDFSGTYMNLPIKTHRKVSNIFSWIEYFAFVTFFMIQMRESKKMRQWIFFFSIGFIILAFYSYLSLGLFSKSNHVVMTYTCFIHTILSIIFFFQLIEQTITPRLTDSYLFWINTAVLVFFGSTLVIVIFANQIMNKNSSPLIHNIWNVFNVFNVAFNTLLGIGIYKWAQSNKS